MELFKDNKSYIFLSFLILSLNITRYMFYANKLDIFSDKLQTILNLVNSHITIRSRSTWMTTK